MNGRSSFLRSLILQIRSRENVCIKMISWQRFSEVEKGGFVKIKGVTTIDKFDGELTIGSVTGIKKIGDFTVKREDLNPLKRVELHCHTKMSDMDGVSEVKISSAREHMTGDTLLLQSRIMV